jgi:hypothetical protein
MYVRLWLRWKKEWVNKKIKNNYIQEGRGKKKKEEQ